jgi:alanine racemase
MPELQPEGIMSIWYNEVKAEISVSAIKKNFGLIRKKCPNPIAVIKSDAYGHGLVPTARALEECGAQSLAAGTVGEAAALRMTPYNREIISLLGPIENKDYQDIIDYRLIPFTGNFEQLRKLNEAAGKDPVQVALKFNTGMSRLGFEPKQAGQVAKILHKLKNIQPVYLCSHLAAADDPGEEEFTAVQLETLLAVDKTLRGAGISCRKCLANSAAILGHPDLHLDAQRPGIALYGGNPFHGNPWEEKGKGLVQAMQVSAPILEIRELEPGQSISYGRTYLAPKKMRVAIVACGYADNYSRGLSNKGWMVVHEKRAPVLGRVCMQLTAVDVSDIPRAERGDRAYILGGGKQGISADELAGWWGTISYEVFCLLGQNQRTYLA